MFGVLDGIESPSPVLQTGPYPLRHSANVNDAHVSIPIAEQLHARTRNGVFLADLGTERADQ